MVWILKGMMGNTPITLAAKMCPVSLIELQVQHDKILEHHNASGSTSQFRKDFSLYHRTEKGISFPFLKIVTKFGDLKMREISPFKILYPISIAQSFNYLFLHLPVLVFVYLTL